MPAMRPRIQNRNDVLSERTPPFKITPREREGLAFLVERQGKASADQGFGKTSQASVLRAMLRRALAAGGFDPDAAPGTPAREPARSRAA